MCPVHLLASFPCISDTTYMRDLLSSRPSFYVRPRAVSPSRPNGIRCVARRSGQDWPKATAVRRLGLDRFEHGAILSWTGSGFYQWSARSILCGAIVRLAHQLISGSSVTACHNPACTAQVIEETGSHFLPARENANRVLDYPSPCLWSPMQGSKAGEAPSF